MNNSKEIDFSSKNLQVLPYGTRLVINNQFAIDQRGIYFNGINLTQGLLLTIDDKFIEENEVLHFLLAYSFEGTIKQILVSADEIQPRNISKLASLGVPIDHLQTRLLSNGLNLMGAQLKSKKLFSQIGFNYDHNGMLDYYGVGHEFNFTNKINNNFSLKTAGTIEGEIQYIRELVVGCSGLEIVFLLSLSSVLIYVLKNAYKFDVSGMVIFLGGDSSIGKSTATAAAVSSFGCPDMRVAGSLVTTAGSTIKGLMQMASRFQGGTIGIDDLGASTQTEWTSFIYDVTNGRSKSMSNTEGGLISGTGFLTNIIINGEKSLDSYTSKAGGARLRIVMLEDISFTLNASHAEQLKSAVQKNYGNLAENFAKKILNDEKLNIPKMFLEDCERLVSSVNIELNAKGVRYAKQLTLALTTSTLISRYYGISFNEEELIEQLRNNIMVTMKQLDYGANAYEKFCSWCVQNRKGFSLNSEPFSGKAHINQQLSGHEIVYLSGESLDQVIEEIQLPKRSVFIKDLKRRNLILCDDDGHNTRKLQGYRVYCIKLPSEGMNNNGYQL